MRQWMIGAALASWMAGAMAQEAPNKIGPADIPPPPPLKESEVVPEGPAPEITIVERDDATVHEYRINGQLYMIQVIPRRGVPYYLVDTNGDGTFNSRRSEIGGNLLIPGWVLLRW